MDLGCFINHIFEGIDERIDTCIQVLIIGGTSYEQSLLKALAESAASYAAGVVMENAPAIFKSLTKETAKQLSTVFAAGVNLVSFAGRASTVEYDKILFELMKLNDMKSEGYTCFDSLSEKLNKLVNFINAHHDYFFDNDVYSGRDYAKKTLYEIDQKLSALKPEKAIERIEQWSNMMMRDLAYRRIVMTLDDGTKINWMTDKSIRQKYVDDYINGLKQYNQRLNALSGLL